MRTLVVWAHPLHGSYSEAVCRTVVASLDRAGHEVTLVDLYAKCYQPVMARDEWRAYRARTPQLDEVVARHVDALRQARQLVFVYPTWWFGMPAMLKGWLERTMVPGVAFDFGPDGRIRGELEGLRSIVGVSTYGSPRWYVHLVGDAGRRTITRGLRSTCRRPWRVRTTWLGLYALDSADDARRAAFLERVDRSLTGEERRTPRVRRRIQAMTGR